MPVNLCIATLGLIDEAYKIVLIGVDVYKFYLLIPLLQPVRWRG